MTTKTRGIRVSERLDREIAREARDRGTSWSAASSELLREAIEMRRAPGVVFADGPAGRRAVVAGSGIDVWEVVASWKAAGQDSRTLREAYPQLTETQLRAALGYYRLFPDGVDERLAREAAWTPERVRRELPFAAPARIVG